jgi:UDP-sulfoquinovose synthase
MRILLAVSFLTTAASFTAPFRVVDPALTSTKLYAAVNADNRKKVIVLGGDGFCGWPTSLYLSDQGHDVVIVDNLSRRNIDNELGCDSLTPIQSPEVRPFRSDHTYPLAGSHGNLNATEQP